MVPVHTFTPLNLVVKSEGKLSRLHGVILSRRAKQLHKPCVLRQKAVVIKATDWQLRILQGRGTRRAGPYAAGRAPPRQ